MAWLVSAITSVRTWDPTAGETLIRGSLSGSRAVAEQSGEGACQNLDWEIVQILVTSLGSLRPTWSPSHREMRMHARAHNF